MKISPLERIVLGISGALILATALLLCFGGGRSASVVVLSESEQPGVRAEAVGPALAEAPASIQLEPSESGQGSGAERGMPSALQEETEQTDAEVTVDLNTATANELEQLPGIGPKRAEAIIAYREAHGPFARVEQVMNVSGIGTGIFQEIRPYITVSAQ